MEFQLHQQQQSNPVTLCGNSVHNPQEGENGGCFSSFYPISGDMKINGTTEGAANEAKTAVDKFLADAMGKLTFEEREKSQGEVHGISKMRDLDQSELDRCLEQMEHHVSRKKKGTAYERTEHMNKAYASNRHLRILFLRKYQYNPQAAALNMIRFFGIKEELFGPEKLAQEILLEDLKEADIQCLKSGCFQTLPTMDWAGRQIFLIMPGLRPNLPMEHQMRANFYTMMTTLRECEHARKNGIVAILYGVGRFRNKFPGHNMRRVARLISSMPSPLSAMHFCCDDLKQYTILQTLVPLLPASLASRFRPHCGTHIECLYALKGYGISEESMPFYHFDGRDLLQFHNTWWQDRQMKDERIAAERKALQTFGDTFQLSFDLAEEHENVPIGIEFRGEEKLPLQPCSKAPEAVVATTGKINPDADDVLYGFGYQVRRSRSNCRLKIQSKMCATLSYSLHSVPVSVSSWQSEVQPIDYQTQEGVRRHKGKERQDGLRHEFGALHKEPRSPLSHL